LIIPIGRLHNNNMSLSVLAGRSLSTIMEKDIFGAGFKLSEGIELAKHFQVLFDYITGKLEYLYIPKEIDTEVFTKLESIGTQVLMGESLHEILDRIVGESKIGEINRELSGFLEDISTKL
ncbi:TPA: ATP-binding protein, partial [Escherichia coli]|nr:ATP-binding protein [Escherichia coli]